MIRLKTPEEIKIMAQGGKILSEILPKLGKAVCQGIFTDELEKMAKDLIAKAGGEPAFLGYKTNGGKPYPAALCASINEAVVHAPASFRREILAGDVVSLDLGMWYKGLCTDMAATIIAQSNYAKSSAAVKHFAQTKNDASSKSIAVAIDSANHKKVKKFIEATKKSLVEAVKVCRAGASVSAIGKKVQAIVEGAGFGVIRDLVGHGVGHEVHEDPMVPNYYDRAFDKIILKEGMVIAIEPMTTMGGVKIELAEDGITYRTADRSIAAHYEATVAISAKGPIILTPIV